MTRRARGDGPAHVGPAVGARSTDGARTFPGDPLRTPAQRRADALGDVCRFFLDHQDSVPDGQRHRPHLDVVIDLDTHGDTLDLGAARTVDGTLHRVRTRGGSAILDHGRATRAVPPPLDNALLIRDHHCRWPGCDRPGHWCEGHHVVAWDDGGHTTPTNLVLLCSRHHHIAHRAGWSCHLDPDGTLHVTDPRGTTRTTRPPATGPPLPLAA